MPGKISLRVAHVSGQDDNHKAVELNNHSPTTQGWQSGRFCLYPQDIVIQLERRCRLRKLQILSHQFLIATKIEFYVGDVPDGTPPSLQNARYTRLGYVALSDNEKTGFKARELKSVHVDANGMFLKLVIHKNHINRHNMYNQVGIVAINVIGDDINSTVESYPLESNKLDDPAVQALYNRPDYISPLDDLAFDMYQDPEVAQIIRKLDAKKQEAVLQERYDYAKKLKQAIADLQKVGEKLGKFDVEKRQAVANEDYDKAKLKKVQMDEYRLQVYKQLEIHDLLELGGSRHPQQFDMETRKQTPPATLPELTPRGYSPPPQPPKTPYDDRPLPAIKNKMKLAQEEAEQDEESANSPPKSNKTLSPVPESSTKAESTVDDNASQRPPTSYEERPLPVNNTQSKSGAGDEEDEEISAAPPNPPPTETALTEGNVTGEPEPLSEQDQREAAQVIEVFGLPIVSKAYSKTWSFREDALLEVYQQMKDAPPSTTKDDAKSMMRAAVLLCNKGIKDKVFAVFTAALNLLRMILTEFVPDHKIPKSETSSAVEKTIGSLKQRSADTAARIRDAAKGFIIEESKFPEVKPLHVVTLENVKPFKLTIAPRLGLSRAEILHDLYNEHKLDNSGLTLENMMAFCTVAIQHTSGEVREKAERIIVALYKDEGAPVKSYLPPDDDKTRRNVLYKQLYEAFDRIDGKPSKVDLKKQKAEAEAAKEKEVKELQQKLQQLRDMAAGKQPVDENAIKDDPKKEKKTGNKPTKKSKPSDDSKPAGGTDDPVQIDQTCIFCGEVNENFTVDGLDLHYWKSCPMLKRCTYCKQVEEIAGLTHHLLNDCASKDTFQKCPRCLEAIPKAEFDEHMRDKSDIPAENGKNHCPLCHQNFSGGEDGWKTHLMGKDGCKQNPRRQQGHKGKGGAKGGKAGGKIPVKAGANSKSTPRK